MGELTLKNFQHFCLSFQVSATEIILTLGQAFEVAYQLAMKVKTRTSTTSLSPSIRRLVDDREDVKLRETTITSWPCYRHSQRERRGGGGDSFFVVAGNVSTYIFVDIARAGKKSPQRFFFSLAYVFFRRCFISVSLFFNPETVPNFDAMTDTMDLLNAFAPSPPTFPVDILILMNPARFNHSFILIYFLYDKFSPSFSSWSVRDKLKR